MIFKGDSHENRVPCNVQSSSINKPQNRQYVDIKYHVLKLFNGNIHDIFVQVLKYHASLILKIAATIILSVVVCTSEFVELRIMEIAILYIIKKIRTWLI